MPRFRINTVMSVPLHLTPFPVVIMAWTRNTLLLWWKFPEERAVYRFVKTHWLCIILYIFKIDFWYFETRNLLWLLALEQAQVFEMCNYWASRNKRGIRHTEFLCNYHCVSLVIRSTNGLIFLAEISWKACTWEQKVASSLLHNYWNNTTRVQETAIWKVKSANRDGTWWEIQSWLRTLCAQSFASFLLLQSKIFMKKI